MLAGRDGQETRRSASFLHLLLESEQVNREGQVSTRHIDELMHQLQNGARFSMVYLHQDTGRSRCTLTTLAKPHSLPTTNFSRLK